MVKPLKNLRKKIFNFDYFGKNINFRKIAKRKKLINIFGGFLTILMFFLIFNFIYILYNYWRKIDFPTRITTETKITPMIIQQNMQEILPPVLYFQAEHKNPSRMDPRAKNLTKGELSLSELRKIIKYKIVYIYNCRSSENNYIVHFDIKKCVDVDSRQARIYRNSFIYEGDEKEINQRNKFCVVESHRSEIPQWKAPRSKKQEVNRFELTFKYCKQLEDPGCDIVIRDGNYIWVTVIKPDFDQILTNFTNPLIQIFNNKENLRIEKKKG